MTQVRNDAQSDDKNGKKSEIKQYISFNIDHDLYAVEITTVREIKGWIPTTSLPNSPEYMRGVINLRGVIVPVFDLRTRFRRGRTEPGNNHVVIIVKLNEKTIGILVDAVSDILTIAEEDILSVPDKDVNPEYAFMEGLVTVEDKMVAIVKPEMLFNMDILSTIDMAAA